MADPKGLFANCYFGINQTKPLTGSDATTLTQAIEELNGVVRGDLGSDDVPLHELTHIISSTIDFPQYDSACDRMISVVKPEWVRDSIKKGKLATPRQYSPDPKYFLSDVVLCCSDNVPAGDQEAIIGGVIALGGAYSKHLTKQVSHIVAIDMEGDKCAMVKSKALDIKIVLPHWFDDCLRLGKRLDERPYQFPNPEILQNSKNAVRHSENKDIVGASAPEPTSLPNLGTSPSASRKQSRVLMGKRVMLSNDLDIGSHLRGKLEELIEEGGGSVTGSVHKAHMFICRYREGDDYKTASRECVDVGTLAWLYHLITYNTWSSPYRKLLHYPVCRTGLPGFQNYKISLSNYSGESRIYLENLVTAAGGQVTKTLKPPPENTHLITAHGKSEKVNAARDWGIEVVNHLWLEESYAKWAVQPASTPRYTHFPQRTNLEEVVGQTKIDRVALERNFFADEVDDGDDEMEEVAQVEVPRRTKAKEGNLFPGLVPASSAFDSPRRAVAGPVGGVAATGGPTLKPSRINSRVTELRTPAASRFVSDGKENLTPEHPTPGTGSSRKAKDVATAKLHDYAPDLALYEKEKKRVGGVVYGGTRDKENKTSKGYDRKRSLDDGETTSGVEGYEMKRRKAHVPPVSMHLMLSGYKRWLAGSGHNELTDRTKLRELGIMLVTDPSKCSHLAAPQILRTHKFIAAMAYAPTVISTDFVDQCLERDDLLRPGDFLLRDTLSEKRFKISISKSIANAKVNQNNLFKGRMIYCVDSIHTGTEIVQSIIEANGGRCIVYRARPGTQLPPRRGEKGPGDAEEDEADVLYLISGTKKDQVKLWPRFRQLAEGQKWKPRIVKTDWLLDQAMAQELRWQEQYELTEADVPV